MVEPSPEAAVTVGVVEYAIGLGPDSYQDACEWTEILHNFNEPVVEEGEEAVVVVLEDGELGVSWAEVAVSGLQLVPNVQYYIHIRTTNTIGALGVRSQ